MERNDKIYIAGHKGLVGSAIVRELREKGFVNLRLVVEQSGGHSSHPPENTGPGVLAQAIVKLKFLLGI